MIIFSRLDKDDLMKKKQSYSNEKKEVYIAENYCDQTGILLSKNQSLNEDVHFRENNDRVSYIMLILLKMYKTYQFIFVFIKIVYLFINL